MNALIGKATWEHIKRNTHHPEYRHIEKMIIDSIEKGAIKETELSGIIYPHENLFIKVSVVQNVINIDLIEKLNSSV